jgi:hypothetical protein
VCALLELDNGMIEGAKGYLSAASALGGDEVLTVGPDGDNEQTVNVNHTVLVEFYPADCLDSQPIVVKFNPRNYTCNVWFQSAWAEIDRGRLHA